jgi:hypothetical protein
MRCGVPLAARAAVAGHSSRGPGRLARLRLRLAAAASGLPPSGQGPSVELPLPCAVRLGLELSWPRRARPSTGRWPLQVGCCKLDRAFKLRFAIRALSLRFHTRFRGLRTRSWISCSSASVRVGPMWFEGVEGRTHTPTHKPTQPHTAQCRRRIRNAPLICSGSLVRTLTAR